MEIEFAFFVSKNRRVCYDADYHELFYNMSDAMTTHTAIKPSRWLNWVYYALMLLVCLPLLTSCESKKIIVNSLDEREANEILVFLASKGFNAQKVKSTEAQGGGAAKIVLWDIAVDQDRVTEAMAMLNQAGLPKRRSQNLLGIFQGSSLVPSEMQEQIRYQAGLAEQIASTIRKIDGILDAEVQISFPKEDPLNPGKTQGKITASVYVKHNGVLDDPNRNLISKIKRLVAASVTGLDYDNVTVIPDRATYQDMPLSSIPSAEEEKEFVTIWSIVLAKDSVTKFRTIFFTYSVLLLLLLLSLIWLGWKIYPLLKEYGGVKELFHIHPIKLDKSAESQPEKKEEEPKKEAAAEDDLGLVDKDIDET